MRTFPLICAVLMLASCNQTPPPPKVAIQNTPPQNPAAARVAPLGKLINANDSSPIVVSDGSIKVSHKPGSYFRVHGPSHASLKLANHNLAFLGYLCDPGTTGCASVSTCIQEDATGTNFNTSACYLNVDPTDSADNSNTSWALSLCDTAAPCSSSTPPVTMAWDNTGNDFERIDMNTTSSFTLAGDEKKNGPALTYVTKPVGHLKSARLAVTTSSTVPPSTVIYDFDLSSAGAALNLTYVCYGSGNACKP